MTLMCAADSDLDRADLTALLDLSARMAPGMRREDWALLRAAWLADVTVDQRVDGLLLLAGPLTDLVDPADETLLLRAFLPRLSVDDRSKVLADLREELDQAERFAGCCDRGDVAELVEDVGRDWVATAEQEADALRSSARHTAETAAQR